MFSSKATALSKRNTIVIHVIVSDQENNLRRLKWLLKMRFFAEIGKVDKVVVVPSHTGSSGLAVAGDILQTGFAFVVFESETIADKALAAAQHFPWPVRGRFNQETNSFERIRYHRCQMQTLCGLEDTLTHVPGENLASTASMIRGNLLSTSDLLAVELRALQSSLQGDDGGKDSARLDQSDLLEHGVGNNVRDKNDKPVEDQARLSKDKKYSPGTKSKIAALLRKSIQEVRLSSQLQADSPARNCATTLDVGTSIEKEAPRSPVSKTKCSIDTEKLLLKIQNVMESMNVDPPSSASTTKKALQLSEIEKHLRVSARTGDLYEVIGWYQEKNKLLQNKTSGGASDGSGPGRTDTDSVSWSTFQSFLDSLKTEVRMNRDLSKGSKPILHGDRPDCARVMCALDVLALHLLAEQMNQERSATDSLKSTIHTQREIIEQNEQRAEGLSERLTDVRERVREYSHEIAELEQENRILSESAARYDVVRDQLFEAESLLVEQEQRLANRDNELRAAHASNVLLRQTVEDLRRENARLLHTQQHHSQHIPHAPAVSAHSRTSSHTYRSHFHNHVLSDSDSEQESKAKAAHSEHRLRHVPASERISRQAESHSKAEPVASLSAQVSKLACTTTSDWIQLYLTRSSTLEEVQATETELAGIKGDLTAILSKCVPKVAQNRHCALPVHAKKSGLKVLNPVLCVVLQLMNA
eukprot:gene20820-23647_t